MTKLYDQNIDTLTARSTYVYNVLHYTLLLYYMPCLNIPYS